MSNNTSTICLHCGEEIERTRTGTNSDGSPCYRKFCSRSCSASFNNLRTPKRQKEGQCATCKTTINSSRKYCKKCLPAVDWDKRTLKETQDKAKYQVSARVRQHARQQMKNSGQPAICNRCGYDKHVEVSHVKAIKDFDPSTSISEVNNLSNLEYLCPNCHWEHENL